MAEPIHISEAMANALAELPLTLQQTAIMLGRSESTVLNYCKRGLLKKRVINGRVGYSAAEVWKLTQANSK